jgi:putative ABC transport system ATP-binding protein
LSAAPLRAERVSRSIAAGGSRFTLHIERFEVAQGARVAVVGPSGCGKSTLFALLALALRPDAGDALMLAGVDALALWRAGQGDALAALRGRSVGFVPQTGALLPFLSLHDNILLPQRIAARPDPARVSALAERLGIAAVLERRPAAVSVGQRQRAAIARALAHRPAVVLADEPTASVHPAQADEILDLLTRTATEDGAALVIATHDAARARAAGYAIAPGRPDADAAQTRFCWPA